MREERDERDERERERERECGTGQGAAAPCTGPGASSPWPGTAAGRRRSAGGAPALGWPRPPQRRDREGAAAPSLQQATARAAALAGPDSGRGSAARGQRGEEDGGPPALGGRRRPGVAAGHPNSEGERGRRGGREWCERERMERGAGPLSGQWPPAAVLAAGEANRERGREEERGGGCASPPRTRTGGLLAPWPRPGRRSGRRRRAGGGHPSPGRRREGGGDRVGFQQRRKERREIKRKGKRKKKRKGISKNGGDDLLKVEIDVMGVVVM